KGCLPSFHALCIAVRGVEEIAQVIMSFVVAGIVLQCGLQNSDAFQAVGKNIVASGLPRQLELLASFCRLSLKVEIETKGVSNERMDGGFSSPSQVQSQDCNAFIHQAGILIILLNFQIDFIIPTKDFQQSILSLSCARGIFQL